MPVRHVWNCDLPQCPNKVNADGAGVPEGWIRVEQQAAGVTTTVLCSTEHLVAWIGAVAAPAKPTVAQARAVMAEHRARNPRQGRSE